jgi:hypothetical protein
VEPAGLLYVSISVFVAVFVVLTVLALLMRLILVVFPETGDDDTAVLAAVTAVAGNAHPGMRITQIEERT